MGGWHSVIWWSLRRGYMETAAPDVGLVARCAQGFDAARTGIDTAR